MKNAVIGMGIVYITGTAQEGDRRKEGRAGNLLNGLDHAIPSGDWGRLTRKGPPPPGSTSALCPAIDVNPEETGRIR